MKENPKKIYFASDFHLGAPNHDKSIEREKKICKWLDSIKSDCEELFLVGDIFDFWFEYKYCVPKGFVRLLGKLASFTDSGIKVHFFVGNHDMWAFDYFPKELGIKVYYEPIVRTFNDKKFYIGHGDGLGPGDYSYKFLKKIFRNRIIHRVFGFLHPSIGIGIADFFSKRSRAKTGHLDEVFLGSENEWLIQYAIEQNKNNQIDYYIFGHRHLPIYQSVGESQYVNIGDWISYCTYAEFDGDSLYLNKFEG